MNKNFFYFFQINEKKPNSRLRKNLEIADNPFSSRSKDLGSSSLNNPINANSYNTNQMQMNYRSNPYMQGMTDGGRETPNTREKLRMAAANNIMK